MSARSVTDRVRRYLDPRPVPWMTVAVLATGMAFADGFVLTALNGATGVPDPARAPFADWMFRSALLTPVVVMAVAAVLARVRRPGPDHGGAKAALRSMVFIVLAGTAVGICAVVASSAHDYYLQVQQIRLTAATHIHQSTIAAGHGGDCSTTCLTERSTLVADLRGVGFAGPILLGVNILVAGWLAALLGGRLRGGGRPTSGGRYSVRASLTGMGRWLRRPRLDSAGSGRVPPLPVPAEPTVAGRAPGLDVSTSRRSSTG